MRKETTYIYSIEGKDIINAGTSGYSIKPNKKFKASLDYSLETTQLDELIKTRKEELFYIKDDKQYTKAIINLTFKYSVKEYRTQIINKQKIYVKHDFAGNIEDIDFKNGLYIKDDKFLAILVEKEITIENNEFMELLLDRQIDLPHGFDFYTTDENKMVFVVYEDLLKTARDTEDIRRELYKNGFKINDNGIETSYVRFKRSSGSSRQGKCLFIRSDYYNDMMDWSYMGLDYQASDKIDLAALESYISLTSSGIIDTIEIDPKSILLIEDFESVFNDNVMVTKIVKIDGKDRLQTKPKEKVKIKNNIWDGQSLLDSGLFGKYKNKGYLLLRNRFFKSACFNTNIQKFFSDNGITKIEQLNGKTLATDIKEIKLITTPSSIKYLKFKTWDEFISKCTNLFGIVKYEKPTHFFNGEMVQTHYQLLNTLQLSEDQVKELLKPSLDYISLLKNDIRVFRNHLDIKIKDDIKTGDINSTNELMFTMLQVNNKFINTNLFINFRQDFIDSFINNIQKGHVLVPGNYSVLFGNPYEMLRATIKDTNHELYFDKNIPDSVLGIDEVYCKNFKTNTKLLVCRSPHISMSGIWLPTNVKCPKIEDYFNLTNEIICLSSIKNNILNRLSGCDFDSDQVLVTDFKLLVENGQNNYDKFLVPVSKVEGEKTKRYNTLEQKSDLDIKTSVNSIGEIINYSQVLNSYLWHMVNNGEDIKSEEIQEIYKDICQLDIMSRIEIDMAKKEFTINNKLELRELKKKYDIKKPKFLYHISKLKSKKHNPKLNKHKELKTTMDYLNKVLKKEKKSIRLKRRNSNGNPVVALNQMLSKNKNIKISDADYHQIGRLIEKCIDLKRKCDQIWSLESIESEEKYTTTNQFKNELINEVSKLKVSPATIKKIINNFTKNPEKIISKENEPVFQLKSIQRKLLSILYKAHTDIFINLFEQNIDEIEILRKVNVIPKGAEIIKIYHMNYISIKNQFTDFLYLTS